MIIEERIYKIRGGQMSAYLKLVAEEGIGIQQSILGGLVGYFVTEIGDLNHVVHLWRYEDLLDRTRRRKLLAENKQWKSFTPLLSSHIEAMTNRILVPTEFSPLK